MESIEPFFKSFGTVIPDFAYVPMSRDIGIQRRLVMEITPKDKFWMNFKLYQLWRFIVLNLKILKAVDHSKRS